MKILAVVLIFSILILFFMIPVAMLGQSINDATNQAIINYDKMDGRQDFNPENHPNASLFNKIIDVSDGSGKSGS